MTVSATFRKEDLVMADEYDPVIVERIRPGRQASR